MSNLAEYQLFLDTMKLILKVKSMVDKTTYEEIVSNNVSKISSENQVSVEDLECVKTFFLNLNENTFYDDCMSIYLNLKKYDTQEEPKKYSSLEFLKVELLKKLI